MPWKYFQALGTETINELKAMIRTNIIGNNEINNEEVNLAEKEFVPNIVSIDT